MTIQTNNLFSEAIQNYQVKTTDRGLVRYVNLDNAATTPALASVEQAVQEYIASYGSVHRGAGVKSKVSTDVYEASRDTIKRFVNAPEDAYVLFTGNTTGAMNTVAYYFSFLSGKVAVSSIEHSSSWLPWVKTEGIKALGSEQVALDDMESVNEHIQLAGRKQVLQYSVNENFEFDLADIEKLLKEHDIKAFVLTASSNATGYCPDIKAIGQLVHKYGAYFIVDACQFVQHHTMDMQELGIDFLAASGHKFYAPYGGGFLIGPKKFFDNFLSYEIGGGNLPYITKDGEFLRYTNQLAHDPGTPNAIGAISMASAFEALEDIGIEQVEAYEHGLAKQVYDYLKNNSKIELYVNDNHLSTVVPFNVKGINFTDVAEELNSRFGIGVRAGSFCVYNVIRQVLDIQDETKIIEDVKAGKEDAVPGFIRASFALCNTQEDVDRFIEAMEEITK
ncbi:aminotransferase class V-fold PLP-dependent enzyme [Patescibacteria group bacterium]|nr:aminotransferase class V-fold PLP-dependent enzyme [Patescibacteria group bacterium]MBU1721537.1 aminotransferase class V-fold PLP-dependent enzyme [Patescibacteria group bacterium]MBU1901503.1 aminotransferase class V-fold PLP-dependent enzyme [Patescibacteria group bacterium]